MIWIGSRGGDVRGTVLAPGFFSAARSAASVAGRFCGTPLFRP